jgi:hypothetical protein
MLGLGNALTRSINYAGLGEGSVFTNAPQIGSFYEGGIVVSVAEYAGQGGNAIVNVVYPHQIQFPIDDTSDPVYNDKDYIDRAIEYVKNFSYIKDGEVYGGWEPATQGVLEYWLDNVYDPSIHSTDLFFSVPESYTESHTANYVGEPIITNTDYYVGLISGVFAGYHKDTLATTFYQGTQEFLINNPIAVVPYKKVVVELRYNEQIPLLDNASNNGTQVKNVGDDLFDLSINALNQESNNKQPETFNTNYNQMFVSTKNGIITCTIKIPLGNDPTKIPQNYQNIPLIWRNLSSAIYAKFELFSYFHINENNIQLFGFNNFLRFLSEVGTIMSVPLRKANQNDLPLGTNYLLLNDIVYASINGQFSEAFVARVFEIDVSALPAFPLYYSTLSLGFQKAFSPTAFDSIYHSGSTVTDTEMKASGATLKEVHFDQGVNTPLPRGLWWGRYKIRDLKFTSNAYIESEPIDSPQSLQNIIVPLFPTIGGLNIDIGSDLEDGTAVSFFKISDYFASTLNPIYNEGESKDMNVNGSAKYAVANTTELNNIDPSLLTVNDKVFVGAGGNSYQSLYNWNGSSFDVVSASENDTYNFRGSMYKRGSTAFNLLDSTDIINYE